MPTERTRERPIDHLSSKHMMSVILLIHESGPCRRVDIYDKVSRNGNMPQKLRQMVDYGILEEIYGINGSMFKLTDSGRKVAELLQRIEEIIA